jgi:hypothetical protein
MTTSTPPMVQAPVTPEPKRGADARRAVRKAFSHPIA